MPHPAATSTAHTFSAYTPDKALLARLSYEQGQHGEFRLSTGAGAVLVARPYLTGWHLSAFEHGRPTSTVLLRSDDDLK